MKRLLACQQDLVIHCAVADLVNVFGVLPAVDHEVLDDRVYEQLKLN